MYMLHYDPFREIRRFNGGSFGATAGSSASAASVGDWRSPRNVLTIHGKTEFTEDTKDEHFIIRERRAGAFQRSVRLPESVNADDAITHYEHGVLSVTLPKAEEKKARRLEIGTPTA